MQLAQVIETSVTKNSLKDCHYLTNTQLVLRILVQIKDCECSITLFNTTVFLATLTWALEYHWEDLAKKEHPSIIYSAARRQIGLVGLAVQVWQLCVVLDAAVEQNQHLASQEGQTGLTRHGPV